MSSKKYPQWIDEYAKSVHDSFVKMLPISWGPVDAISLIALLNGSFSVKIYKAIKSIQTQKCSIQDIAKSFSCSSTLRVALCWLIWEYQNTRLKNKEQFKEIVELFVEVLKYMTKKDIFAYKSNIGHTRQEIEGFLNEINWQFANSEKAREMGKLYNSLSSLVFALYGDFFPQDSHEIYGPYNAFRKFGKNTIFLIKHFPKIRPVELWPEIAQLKHKDVKVFQVYKNVKFKCELIGMHSIYQGDLINNLVAYAIMINGKYRNNLNEIKALSDYFVKAATKQSLLYDGLSKKEAKKRVLEWECYQFFDFFKLAKMDWQPTKQMIRAINEKIIKNKHISDRFELDKFPSFKQYVTSPKFDVYWLKDLYK